MSGNMDKVCPYIYNEENKGAEAAMSAVEMVNLLRTLRD